MVGVNQAERVEASAFRIAGAVGRVLGQVVLHQRQRILHVPAVNHAQTSGGGKLGPKEEVNIEKKNFFKRLNIFVLKL